MVKDGNEADKNQIIVHDFGSDTQIQLAAEWNLSPGQVLWSHDSKQLILAVGEDARVRIFTLDVPAFDSLEKFAVSGTRHSLRPHTKPVRVTNHHTVGAIQRAGSDGSLVFTQSNARGPNNAFIVRPSGSVRPANAARFIPDNSNNAFVTGESALDAEFKGWTVEQITDFGLRRLGPKHLDDPVDFKYTGAEGHTVQGWVYRPPGFHERDRKKWPIILAIHGGPQSAWEDSWSTRWNMNGA